MAQVIDKRLTAEVDGDFVVFPIGMRINRFLKQWKWLPVFFAMPKMVRELERNRAVGYSGPTSTNRRIGSSGGVGIWHETYLVPAGAHDSVYNNMPPSGLGAATKLVPAAGRKASAAGRASAEPYPADARTDRIGSEPLTR